MNVTPVTAVPAVIVTPEAGFAATTLDDVATLNEVFANAPAAGLVSPLMVSVPAVEFANAHDDANVTTTVCVESVSVAPVHVPVKPFPGTVIVTVDWEGMMTPEGKVTVIVDPELNAPDEPVVKPTVHDVVVLALARVGVKVTLETALPKTMLGPESVAAVTSCEVATVKPVFEIV